MPATTQSPIKALLKSVYRAVPKRQAYKVIRRLWTPPERLYQHLHFEGPFSVDVDERRRFLMMSHADQVENQIFWTGLAGDFEAYSIKIWTRLAEHSKAAILDVGANTGVYTLAARAVNRSSPIFAFEPIPGIAARLRQNIRLNGFDVVAVEKALSDVAAQVPIYHNPELGYDASLESGHGSHTMAHEIEAIPLDLFLSREGNPTVDLIKLDVEEHEPAVVRGGFETIKTHMPSLLIETIFERPTAELNEQLGGLGYLIFNIDEQRGLIPSDRLKMTKEASWNNLLCRPDVFERAKLGDFLV